MLTKAYLRKGDGFNQTEMVEKRVLKIEEVWLSTDESEKDLEKRQLSEISGYLVTLRAILRISSSADIDGNFIFSGGVSSTGSFNIMIKK